jgi:hypothetical protein
MKNDLSIILGLTVGIIVAILLFIVMNDEDEE